MDLAVQSYLETFMEGLDMHRSLVHSLHRALELCILRRLFYALFVTNRQQYTSRNHHGWITEPSPSLLDEDTFAIRHFVRWMNMEPPGRHLSVFRKKYGIIR